MDVTLTSSHSAMEAIQVIPIQVLAHIPSSKDFSVTKTKTMLGDVEHITILAKWHLYGDNDGIELDAKLQYEWCVCLVRGLGVERDFEEGYDLLVESKQRVKSSSMKREVSWFSFKTVIDL
jgi:hypothetical protein